MRTILLLTAVSSLCAISTSASAQAPVAIIEQINGNPPGIEVMDYVEAGRIIRLGARDSIELAYLNSCVREVIRGGTFRVGVERSEAISSHIESFQANCAPGRMISAGGQASESASLVIHVFRGRR